MRSALLQVVDEQERRARRRWLGFIGAFFVLQGALWAVVLTLVHDDPSHAVVPDYHERAVHWDEARAKKARSRALGWTVAAAPASGGGLDVRLLDRGGQPVAGARVRGVVFHGARAGRPQTLDMTEVAPGRYHMAVRVDRPGRWHLRVEAERGADEVFQADTTLDLVRQER